MQIDHDQIKDKIWHLENFYRIRSNRTGLSKLKVNEVQRRIIEKVQGQSPIRHFDLKSRQQGVSTFWLLYWLDDTIFHPGINTGILAHKRESLSYLSDIIRYAHSSMPTELRPDLGDDSKTSLSFPSINSKIFCSLEIRSTGLNNLHVSEWCLTKDLKIQGTMGAINASTTNITGESTGNGIGNDGYEVYQGGKKGENGYSALFHPWFLTEDYRLPLNGMEAPVRTKKELWVTKYAKKEYDKDIDDNQILWRRFTEDKLKKLFPQEHPETDEDAFLMSGVGFFDLKKVHRLSMESRDWMKDPGPWKVGEDEIYFDKPKSRCIYAAGADTSEGVHDYSVLKIINVTERKEAYVYRARVGIDYFYKKCNTVCREFNNALLGVERNNHGHAVILGLEKGCLYPNMYKEDNKRVIIAKDLPKEKKTGWLTTKSSKFEMCDQLKLSLEGDSMEDEDNFMPELTWYDRQLFDECLTFQEDEGKLKAIEGKYDDAVIATAIALQMYFKLRGHQKNTDEVISDDAIFTGEPRIFT